MRPFLALVLFALSAAPAAAQDKKKTSADDATINGEVVANDLPDKVRNHPCKIHTFKLTKDKLYVIDLESKDFDAYLRIEDAGGKELAKDDDGGTGLNSRIRFAPPKDGNYQVIATTFGGGTGAYTLKVRAAGAAPKAGALPAAKDGKVHTVGAGLKIESRISDNDPKNRVRLGSHAQVYLVKMKAGKSYTIDMESTEIDSYLRLEDDAGKELAHDDDGGEKLNARIAFRPQADGTYRIVATTFMGGAGPFTLKVREE